MESHKLKEARGNAQRRFDEVCRFINDGPNNMAVLATKVVKQGGDVESIRRVFDELHKCVADAEARFEHAISIPDAPPVPKSRLTL